MSGAAPERGGSERDIAMALRLRPDPPREAALELTGHGLQLP